MLAQSVFMTIAFFEVEDWERAMLEDEFRGNVLLFFPHPLTAETVTQITNAEVISLFIYSHITSDVLVRLPKLKFIATRSTGYDHVDLSACKQKGIAVANVPVYGVDTIAEHTFALILALSRKLIPSVARTRKGDFRLDGLRTFDLTGKTLGVVGLGHIGKRVVELARAFHLHILVYTRHPDPAQEKILGITFVDLDNLLASSDIVTRHVPLTNETKHMINKENITHMKKRSYLINTARGAIVETEAILGALAQGILAGVGLDVLEEECSLKEERELLTSTFLKTCDLKTQLLNHVLLTKEDVIITPHNAFNSHEALQEIVEITIENIRAFLDGKQKNLVR